MSRSLLAFSLCMSVVFASIVHTPFAEAQTPRPAQPEDNLSASQVAFEALSEVQRRAIQNDLVWVTDFTGAALGTFGKLTFEAVQKFQRKLGEPADGILTGTQRLKLAEMADKARSDVGFKIVEDANTGSGVGVSSVLMGKAEKALAGSKWINGDKVILETVRTKPDKADMAATFERFATAVVQGRRVTYKLLRPDFFVVAGDIGQQKFYTRFAPTADGLRGFTLTYDPKLMPDMNRVSIAIANTFEPIYSGNRTAASNAAASPTNPLVKVETGSAAIRRFGTALILSKGVAVTPSSLVKDCSSVTVAGKAVQISASIEGLSLLTGETIGQPPTYSVSTSVSDESAVTLGFGSDGKLQAAPGRTSVVNSTVNAALQVGFQGGAVMDQRGNLLGLILNDPSANPQIGGVYMLSKAKFVPSGKLNTLFSKQPLEPARSGAALSTGELSQIAGNLIVAAVCQPR